MQEKNVDLVFICIKLWPVAQAGTVNPFGHIDAWMACLNLMSACRPISRQRTRSICLGHLLLNGGAMTLIARNRHLVQQCTYLDLFTNLMTFAAQIVDRNYAVLVL